MDIKWTDTDPRTGQRRYLCAERFAGKWTFWYKHQRRGEWTHRMRPGVETWELILDALQRRYRRREGVSDEDIRQVQEILARLRAKQRAQMELPED
jgi:hypothetical protein